MINITSITEELGRLTMTEALRRHIGPGRKFTADEAARAIDVQRRTIDSWLAGQSCPCFYKQLRLCAWLGEPFTCDLLAVAGQRAKAVEPGDGCPHRANAELASALSIVADALRDGRMDHHEEPVVFEAVKRVAIWSSGYVAARDPITKPLRAMPAVAE